jgi:hypothetical protein
MTTTEATTTPNKDHRGALAYFAEANHGKEITGTPKWFNDYVNINSSFYAVSKYMPIGRVVGFKLPNQICFVPSEHWKSNGYPGYSSDYEYLGKGIKPMVREVDIQHIALYDKVKLNKYGKPQNYKDFAYIYAGEKIKLNSYSGFMRWPKISDPIGMVIGYSALKEKRGHIYYAPNDAFTDDGFGGFNPAPNEIIYTINGMNDDNAPMCSSIKMDDVSIYTDPECSPVAIYDVATKPLPPKGSVDGDHFAVKYAGKKIKATYKYGHYLSAIRPWNYEQAIGTIIGVDTKKICFTPSKEFQDAGWEGINNFGKFSYTTNNIGCDRYYTVDMADIELMTPEDYEDQNEGELLTDDGLTANQKFAVEFAGKEILSKGPAWTRILSYDTPVGKVIGYKGSLICYAPSKEMIKAGFEGQHIDDIVYTDVEAVGVKCYTLISSEAVRCHGLNKTNEFSYTNYGKHIKATGGIWAELVNSDGKKWDMEWPIGDVVGYHSIHHCICFTPSKEMLDFGFNKGNRCYVGVINSAKATEPYYQIFDAENIELVNPGEKEKKLTKGAQFAEKNNGKRVRKSGFPGIGWSVNETVGVVVGYKDNGSIIWVPTKEYAEKFPPSPIPENCVITQKGLDINTLVHSCWHQNLAVVVEEVKTGWIKQHSGGWRWEDRYTQQQQQTQFAGPLTSTPPKKKKKPRDKPWDNAVKVEPLDIPPFIEEQL